MFVGGDLDTFNKIRPLLESIGDKDHISFCGPSGSGQVVEGVNLMAQGLINAALLESVSYGINAGITPETLRGLLGGDDGWRKMLAQICTTVEKNEAEAVGIRVGQYALFLTEAREKGFDLPVSRGLLAYLAKAEQVLKEGNRMAPSLWRELTTGAAAKRAAARK
jgi:3-hydroxyisobutyrate dehydrogenase-like beta-hydroxyacid dehydrogenase